MSCGGRVYKGDTIVISVPFDVEDYENLVITYSTTGYATVVKTEDEVTIEDGFITYVSDGGELDLLPDGVIYYTISYEVDGVDHVESTNTPLYLKTPAGYSGKTADDIYQDGYEAGLNDCSGSTPCDCSSAVTEAYQSGYTAGQADCSGSSCNLQNKTAVITADTQTVTPDQGYDGMGSVSIDANSYGQAKYDQGYASGYEDAEEEYPKLQYAKNFTATTNTTIYPDSAWDAMKRVNLDVTPVYNSGYAAGLADCSGSTCNLVTGATDLMSDMPIGVYYTIKASEWAGGGADGFSEFTVYDLGFGQAKYDEGYQSGYTDGRQTNCRMQAKSITLTSPYVTIEPDFGYAGLSEVSINGGSLYYNGYNAGSGYGYSLGYQSGYTEGNRIGYNNGKQSGFTQGYTSGYTDGYGDGYLSGISTTDCSEAAAEAYELGHQSGYTDGWNSGYTYGNAVGRKGAYKDGEMSVIQSFFTGNTVGYGYNYGYVIAYYYTPSGQVCVITGYDRNCDERWYDSFDRMSVDGGTWESPTLYYYLTEGWHQIRFRVIDKYLHYAFNHNFPTSPVEDPLGNMVTPYMDALKAVSIPEQSYPELSAVTGLIGTFEMNTGIRILSTSLNLYGVYSPTNPNGNALSGATNLNIIISHYQGNENVNITSDVQNGILFYPAGKSSTHSSTLSGWTKMELF